MKHSIVAAITGLGLIVTGAPLLAQEQAPQTPPGMEQAQVGEPEVEKFAEIYVEIEKTRSELSQEMENVEDEQEAQDIQGRMQEKIVSTIQESGWTMEQYNQVAQAINNDPQLRERAINHIKQMSDT